MKEPFGIISDYDGVMVDNTPLATRLICITAQTLELPLPNANVFINFLRGIWGNNVSKMIEDLAAQFRWPNGAVDDFLKTFTDGHENSPYPKFTGLNLSEQFEKWKKAGNFITICSNRDKASILNRLKIDGFKKNLFCHHGSNDKKRFPKPDPRALDDSVEALLKRGVNTERMVFIGDTLVDLMAARNHRLKLKFIAVSSGASSISDFRKAGIEDKYILSAAAGTYPARLPEAIRLITAS